MPGIIDAPGSYATTNLPDINVWRTSGIAVHPRHQRARRWWHANMPGKAVFCRTTARGLTRLFTNPTVMAGSPLSTAKSWSAYQSFLILPEVSLVIEQPGIDAQRNALINRDVVTPKLRTDTCLAAFALSSRLQRVSFDNNLGRFPRLD